MVMIQIDTLVPGKGVEEWFGRYLSYSWYCGC
jgi:hypothetical protein